MHELSIAQGIADHAMERAGDRPVRVVEVRIGYLRQVVPDSLTFAWEMLTEGTSLADAELVIDHVAAVVRCGACGVDTTLDWPVLACSVCESHDVVLRRGDEFELAWIDMVEEVH